MATPRRAAWAAAVMVLVAVATAKECTNQATTSHTVQARLQASPEWRRRERPEDEPPSHGHHHLNHPTDEAARMDLLPPPPRDAAGDGQREEFDWAMLYRSLKGHQHLPLPVGGGDGVSFKSSAAATAGPFLEDVSLHDVRLDPDGDAAFGRAQRTNLEYLLLLDVDRLVWSFRVQAVLPAAGEPYGGWEGPDIQLRGHFVGTYTPPLLVHRHTDHPRRQALTVARTTQGTT
jgi:hypothetical protein